MLVKELNRNCNECIFKKEGLCKSKLDNNLEGTYKRGLCLKWDDEEDLDSVYEKVLISNKKKEERAAKKLEEKEYIANEDNQIKLLKSDIAQLTNSYDLLEASDKINALLGVGISSLRKNSISSRKQDIIKEKKKLEMELKRVESVRKNKIKERKKSLKAVSLEIITEEVNNE